MFAKLAAFVARGLAGWLATAAASLMVHSGVHGDFHMGLAPRGRSVALVLCGPLDHAAVGFILATDYKPSGGPSRW